MLREVVHIVTTVIYGINIGQKADCQNQTGHGREAKNSQIYQATTGKWVKLDLYTRPMGFRRFMLPEFLTSAHEGGKIVRHKHRPLLPFLPQQIFLVLLSVRG